MSPRSTTWQTVGPFFSIGLSWLYDEDVAGPAAAGERVTVEGQLLDGDGQPVPDGILEIWQANSCGKYAHPDDMQDKPLDPGFKGYGRVPTDDQGRFRFTTIKPGRVPGPPNGSGSRTRLQAPHLVISVFTRGLLRRLITRMYFPDEPSNNEDLALNLIDPARRHTLIASKMDGRANALEWNVILQGADETVFFDC
jgi:protocatechuate 3,4-dioxygenase, alpha subunit